MKKFIVLVLIGICLSANAQQVQWASKVIKFSSDLGGKQNGIKRILGKPDAFPQGGPSPNAWTPKNALDGREVVVVGFEKPQTVKQVAVFENANAGCVNRILADNGSGKFETVWVRQRDWSTPLYSSTIHADRAYYYNRKRRKVQTAPEAIVNPGVEYAILDKPVGNVVAIKVEFIFATLHGAKQIDAIGISDSDAPITAAINSTPQFEALQVAVKHDLGSHQPGNPTITADGKTLFFTSYEDDREFIYTATIENGTISNPVRASASLNRNDLYNYVESAANGRVLKGGNKYNRGTGETGFEFLALRDGNYVPDGPLKITAFNNYDDTADATLSSDGSVVMMGIESDLSQGGADLYFAKKKEDGTFGFLQNLGKVVNSAGDENMPQLLSDNRTLLFGSNGFSSYGDYDLYLTYRLDDSWKNWSEPINLGSKINSGSFDGSPYYDEKNEMLYFTRADNGKNSLYSVKLPMALLAKL